VRTGYSQRGTPREKSARALYLAYLKSPEWRQIRNAALKRAHFCCEICGSKRQLQVHHLNYEHLGHEWDSDLQVCCVGCHERAHPEQHATHFLGRYLTLAREILTDESRHESDADLREDLKRRCAQQGLPYDTEKVGRALEILRRDFPCPAQPAIDRLVDRRQHEPVTAFDARAFCRDVIGDQWLQAHAMPRATPLSPRKADAVRALQQVMQAIRDQIAVCEDLERTRP